MHNIDRTVDEMESLNEFEEDFGHEFEEQEEGMYEQEDEFEDEDEFEFGDEFENEFEEEDEFEMEAGSGEEEMEMELATELLSVNSEEELEEFLGGLFRKVKRAAGKFIKSPAGSLLKKYLKKLAKKAIPIAGSAVGGFFGGPAGAALGGNAANMVGKALGLELEGLSPEDKELEVAKGYIRYAKDAIRRAASDHRYRYAPRSVARSAMINAAKKHAPGFLSPRFSQRYRQYGHHHRYPTANYGENNGTWQRRQDGSIILYGI